MLACKASISRKLSWPSVVLCSLFSPENRPPSRLNSSKECSPNCFKAPATSFMPLWNSLSSVGNTLSPRNPSMALDTDIFLTTMPAKDDLSTSFACDWLQTMAWASTQSESLMSGSFQLACPYSPLLPSVKRFEHQKCKMQLGPRSQSQELCYMKATITIVSILKQLPILPHLLVLAQQHHVCNISDCIPWAWHDWIWILSGKSAEFFVTPRRFRFLLKSAILFEVFSIGTKAWVQDCVGSDLPDCAVHAMVQRQQAILPWRETAWKKVMCTSCCWNLGIVCSFSHDRDNDLQIPLWQSHLQSVQVLRFPDCLHQDISSEIKQFWDNMFSTAHSGKAWWHGWINVSFTHLTKTGQLDADQHKRLENWKWELAYSCVHNEFDGGPLAALWTRYHGRYLQLFPNLHVLLISITRLSCRACDLQYQLTWAYVVRIAILCPMFAMLWAASREMTLGNRNFSPLK